jgi:hypothetical protein
VIASKNPETITSVISSFTRQNEALLDLIDQLLYYYRGALQRDDAWALSYVEREMMISFLNDRFKDAGEMIKKKIPVFL